MNTIFFFSILICIYITNFELSQCMIAQTYTALGSPIFSLVFVFAPDKISFFTSPTQPSEYFDPK